MNYLTEEVDPIEKQMIRAGALNRDDLMFNQAGELSTRQKRWLMIETVGWGVQIGIYVLLILWAWVFYSLQFQQGGMSLLCTGGLFWTVVMGICILVCYEHARPVWADINENDVMSVAGTISIRSASGKGAPQGRSHYAPNWSLQIREQQFSIRPAVYQSLINEMSYRVFYTPALKRVINIEPLFHLEPEDEQTEEKPS